MENRRTCRLMAACALVAAMSCCIRVHGLCPADVNGDNTVNVTDLLTVINGWGACPLPCPPTCGADVNDDCAVNVADLLSVITAWGACPCSPAGPEPNDTCSTFTTLAPVGSNQLLVYSAANLHNGSDIDIFRIVANETDSTCSCCDGGFCLDEDFRLRIRLTVPSQASGSYLLCTGSTCAGVTTSCVAVPPGQIGERIWIFDGSCAGQDNYEVFVRISSQVGGNIGCANYSLTYEFTAGCF